MTDDNNYSLNAVINALPILRGHAKKLIELDRLTNIVHSALDAKTKKYCAVANLKGDTLILSTPSPTWKHQIRFFQFEILNKLQNNASFKHITQIKTKVDPDGYNALMHDKDSLLSKPSLSAKNAKTIMDISNSVESPKLAQALKNLARHGTGMDDGPATTN